MNGHEGGYLFGLIHVLFVIYNNKDQDVKNQYQLSKLSSVKEIWWYDMIWYDMIWYDMIWYDMIWYDMILFAQNRGPKAELQCTI